MNEARPSKAGWNLALIIVVATLGVVGAGLLFSREAFPLPDYTQYLPVVLIAITEPLYLTVMRFLPIKNIPESCKDKTGMVFATLSIILLGISLLMFALWQGGSLHPNNNASFLASAGLIAGAPIFVLHNSWRIIDFMGDKEASLKNKILALIGTAVAFTGIVLATVGAIQGNLPYCMFLLVMPAAQIIDANIGAE